MSNSFKNKTIDELLLIISQTPNNAGMFVEAQKELKRREFWRKDLISWAALLISLISMLIHMVKYIQTPG